MPLSMLRSTRLSLAAVAGGLLWGMLDCHVALATDIPTPASVNGVSSPVLFLDQLGSVDTPTYRWAMVGNQYNFTVEDGTEGGIPFRIAAGGGGANTLNLVNGRVGIGAYAPAANLHVLTSGFSTSLRLEAVMDPQVWEMQADSGAFRLVDVTNNFETPLTVAGGAPQASLHVGFDGNVGFGTGTPTAPIHARKASQPLVAESVARFEISDDSIGNLEIRNGSTTDGIFHPRLRGTTASQAVPLTMEGLITTDAGANPVVAYDAARRIGGAVVTRPLVVYRNNGVAKVIIGPTGVVTATSFNPVSSRARKHDIADLDSQEAANALRQLAPVKFLYNDDESNQKRVGFIAEDVPEVVATPDRQSVPIMDVVALVTRVVKDQQQTIDEQKKSMEEQKNFIVEQRKLNELLIKRLNELEGQATARK